MDDPEEELDELLREVDEEFDDTPKGRSIKEVLESLKVRRKRGEEPSADGEGS